MRDAFAPDQVEAAGDDDGAAEPNVSEIRDILGNAGLKESQIQRFGKPGENEILVRTPVVEGTEEGAAPQILAALSQHYNQARAKASANSCGFWWKRREIFS